MALKSIKATDRELAEWFQKIRHGEIKLPRFQRFEAWDRKRITGLLSTVVNNLPLGITLILNVGDEPQFIDRYIKTAPQTEKRVTEHLLDGQQRLTAFWRMMHNNYEWESYYVYIPEFDKYNTEKPFDSIAAYCQARWKKAETRYPMWADNSSECYYRGLIPADLLRPGDQQNHIDEWMEKALNKSMPVNTDPDFLNKIQLYFKEKEVLKGKIVELREIIAHYNLPFLALPAITPKETALNVFINMNTNSKPLSLYDIIVAEVESVRGQSLHDLVRNLDAKYPNIKYYFSLSDLILSTSALLQDKLPNQKGMIEMDKVKMVSNWDQLERGLYSMAVFLESQGIYDRQRLPTNAVLAVIAALYTLIPESGDRRGQAEILLKKYLWSSFFTDRYENSAATHAYYDYINLKNVLTDKTKADGTKYTEIDIPVLNRSKHLISSEEELMVIGWPKQENIRARAILAVASYFGAYDFADGQRVSREHLQKREYHHIFPDALLEEAGINSYLALNCALITNTTNRVIGRKDPIEYLKDRYKWSSKDIVSQRLNSHLIPAIELANGGYEGLEDQTKKDKLVSDFERFMKKRAYIVRQYALKLCDGENITLGEFSNDPS